MKITRTINLTFSEEDFQKLKNIKEKEEAISKERINWERFVWKKVCGK